MDVGLVCDRCSTASAMGTPRCIRCGASLSLEDDGRAESAPYADDADVAYDDAAGGGSFGHDTAREPYGLEATPPPYGQATATPAPASTPAPAPVFARSASASFDHDPHGLRASAAEPETRVGAP
ncbi:MAG TPA: hypothetical protein VHE35_02645, partial [Kofleriaceae bacterium]|nr:hypothetical protein [Kofleriaceae bacterium]